ncbi:hypothetical protein AGABI2DRAFT_202311 [Agaricus bisporus var. bisporus H97]|uniref:hypothetical protein n=1 Tax=Agaricus bisporus var. bisporus (strain H97 / ATCC MYA-4626 / FGSC 10389) TaxID=936046 RepID=UPI00029F7D7A|nr:hypothetical protein AGABI2DRAFT_202311 [Agaricus bisporus var. bisporus H97]EKV48019.1 hypothetical protein AGABI2DRAFT_202311 [Agaricus bisporus var. bisporus H97]
MSKRPPNELESRLHKAILSTPNKEMTAKDTETIISEPNARERALNFLLGVGLIKTLVDSNRRVSFRAVTKGELVATKDLNGEENLVFSHIKAAGSEGIWTKHLKTKTNLHQTIIDRSLKTLTQKRLVKRVPSVQHPTRKIYMLEGLEPSISLTGGPWYTDNELDTEFIQHLTEVCYKFVRDTTFPKRKEGGGEGVLYAISNPPRYPTAQDIRSSLKKAKLTETELSVEHVEMLLNVLILDGKIEKLPAFGTSMWDSIANDEPESDSDREEKQRKKRKSKSVEEKSHSKKRKKRNESESEESSSSEDESRIKRRRKRRKDDDETESEPESATLKRKKKKKKVEIESDSSDAMTDGEPKKKKRKKLGVLSPSDASSSEEDEVPRRKRKYLGRSPSPFLSRFGDETDGSVYRAIKEEHLSLGWSEAPCTLCPSFDFCKGGGPVNPKDCVYYGEWLTAASLNAIEDQE